MDIPTMGGSHEQVLEAKNLVVNGVAEAAPEPAAGASPPAGG
jgi:hypothetical protein